MTAAAPREPGNVTPDGRIVRTVDPQNEEFDLGRLDGPITSNAAFYIRSHGPVPALDPERYRLQVGGMVARILAFSLENLRAMRQAERPATLECAGNRRTFQDPVPLGVPWQDGAVSNARWGGVPLASVLREAGVLDGARHVLLEGTDQCPTDTGPQLFARSIPLEIAQDEETLLALTMNGEPLPPEHGGPLRVVLPRYYAMNSIKWLGRIALEAEPCAGHFQVNDYRLWFSADDPGRDIGPMKVFAAIARPRPHSALSPGRTRIDGTAWTGTGAIQSVEVSTDGGATWQPAKLEDAPETGVWRLFSLEWEATPGTHVLMARATDSEGNSQPVTQPPNRKGYANNFMLRVPVAVMGGR